MTKTILYILLVIGTITAYSQDQKLPDSISKKIALLDDTVKVRLLNDFSWKNRSNNPELARLASKQALDISVRINNKSLQAKSLNLLGVVERNIAHYDLALTHYKKALSCAEEAKDSLQIAFSYNNIGGVYRLEGNSSLALEYILKALKIFENLNNKSGISFCTINIGLIYNNQQNYLKALEYLNYTVRIREEIKDRSGKALALNLIADVYENLGKNDISLQYYEQVFQEYEAVGDKKGIAAVWAGQAKIYYESNNYTKALELRNKALSLSKELNYVEGIVRNKTNIGLILARMGNFAEGEKSLTEAKNIVDKINTSYIRLENIKAWSEFYTIKKDYEKALFYYKEYTSQRDTVLSRESISLVQSMESIYRYEKSEKENAILMNTVEKERNSRYLFILLFLSGGIVTAILYWRYTTNKRATQKLVELNATKDKFFGIIAHDLKNPFHALISFTDILLSDYSILTEKEKIKFIEQMNVNLKQTYRLLENLLFWSRAQIGGLDFNLENVNLKNLVDQAINSQSSIAQQKRITIKSIIPPEKEVRVDEEMFKTIIRNLIANSIKFSHSGSEIVINYLEEVNNFKLSVADQGIGIPSDQVNNLFNIAKLVSRSGTAGEKGSGLGLILCNEFVSRHNGKIEVESTQGKGTIFTISIPNSI